jgi:hypothetical protein
VNCATKTLELKFVPCSVCGKKFISARKEDVVCLTCIEKECICRHGSGDPSCKACNPSKIEKINKDREYETTYKVSPEELAENKRRNEEYEAAVKAIKVQQEKERLEREAEVARIAAETRRKEEEERKKKEAWDKLDSTQKRFSLIEID